VTASLLLALFEWFVADLVLDGPTTSFWERGAAIEMLRARGHDMGS
jgi:hypothetical protein